MFLKKIFSRKKNRAEEELDLEKGDLPAMFLAAVLVYAPYFLIFIGALLFLGWVFGAFR